jgi:hypothetical protein
MSAPLSVITKSSSSSWTTTDWLLAVGASFTGVTVTLTVAVLEPPWESVPRTTKLELPLKLATGVNVHWSVTALHDAVPWEASGCAWTV